MKNKRNEYSVRLHMNTATYLMESLKESMLAEPDKWELLVGDPMYSYPPEHSDESIIRRCVQIRQELLQVIKKLR